MRRVLLTVHKFFPQHRAGTEILTLKVARELMARGYDVMVVTANPPDRDARHAQGPDTSSFVYEGLPVHVVEEPLRLRNYRFTSEYRHAGIAEHFREILLRFRPDILHIFHAQNLSASIIDVAEEEGVPVVCSTTDFWFVCPVVQLKRPDGRVCRGPSAGALNCLTCYTPNLFPPQEEFNEAFKARFAAADRCLEVVPALGTLARSAVYTAYRASKLAAAVSATVERPGILRDRLNRSRAVMVPTRLMRDIFVENGIRPELIRHVPFGIDTAPLIPYQTKTLSNTLRLGFIGTLFEHKGVDLLIRAFHRLPADARVELKIYGDPGQFPDYGALLQKLASEGPNAGRISFLGTFPNEKLGEVLSNLDVLVVPSRWYENTPLVIQSALATRTPLVATDLGGMSELIEHGRNGLLFKLNDVQSLCDQLLCLLNDAGYARRLSDNIAPQRTVGQMVDDIEAVYQQCCPSPVAAAAARQAEVTGKQA